LKQKILFSIIFVLFAALVAYSIKPETKEMIYVYEKSNNLKKVNEQYQKVIDSSPEDLKIEKKVIDNLYTLRDEKYLDSSIEYYEKVKDYEIARRIIDAFKMKNDYDNALKWLDITYKDFDKTKDLEEIIALASSTNNKELLKRSLKTLYTKTKDVKILFSLYGLNEKEFALTELYSLSLENKLDNEEYLKTLKLWIYEKDFIKAYEFYSNKKLSLLEPFENEKEYLFLLNNLNKSDDLKKLYKYFYKNSKDDNYYKLYTEFLLYEGDIEEYLVVSKNRYKKKKDLKELENIIKYEYLNEDIYSYLEYLSEKALLEKDIKTAEVVISQYLDLGEVEPLYSFLEKLNNLSSKFDKFKELSLQTLVYLEMNDEAEKILLQYPPEDVTSNVVYSIFTRKLNEESMPYFMEVLKNSNDKITKSKLFRYRYKTLRLFSDETYKYFGKPSTFKKLYSYVELFEKEDKNKILSKFAESSNDPMLISEIAQYFLFDNEKDIAITFFEKALNIYPKNKLALKRLATVYLYNNNLKGAKELLSKIKEIDKKDAEIDYYLGELFFIEKNKELYSKYYTNVINNMKTDNIINEFMVLRSKVRLASPLKYKKELDELILKSENDINVIADVWFLYFENKNFDYLIQEFDKNKELINNNARLKEIEVDTYIALKDFDIARDKLTKLLNEDSIINKASLYEKLGSIEYQTFNKIASLDNYEKSLALENRKDKKIFTEELRKEFRTKVDINLGIRSEIKESQIGFKKVIDKIKVHLKNDSYDSYNSPKISFSDLNERFLIGIGKDYAKLQLNKLTDLGLSLSAEKSIDVASKTTLADKLKYEKISLSFDKPINENLFYSLKMEYYKYKNFDRKRVENSFYLPLYTTYFTNFSYVFENVNNQNNYGYEDKRNYLLSFGESDKINDTYRYYYSVGTEYDNNNKMTYFTNFNLYYRNEDSDISLQNSFSKDPLNDNYNFNSMLFYSYYF